GQRDSKKPVGLLSLALSTGVGRCMPRWCNVPAARLLPLRYRPVTRTSCRRTCGGASTAPRIRVAALIETPFRSRSLPTRGLNRNPIALPGHVDGAVVPTREEALELAAGEPLVGVHVVAEGRVLASPQR